MGAHQLSDISHIKNLKYVCSQLVVVFFCLIGLSSMATNATVEDSGSTAIYGADSASQIQSLIETNELEDAIALATRMIAGIESNASRYDVALIRPLTLLGDGYSNSGDHIGALDAYDRARHISRLNHGLHNIKQVDVLYREAQSYFALGQIHVANDRHEYAYSMYARSFEPFSAELLPGIFTLGDWYTDTSNIFAARGLFEYALRITEQHLARDHADNLRALKSLARTYRLERYRPPHNLGFAEPPSARPYQSIEKPFVYFAELNSFAPGERALLEVTRIELGREIPDKEAIARAKLDLADWYLLFEKLNSAHVFYSDVCEMYNDEMNSEFYQAEFAKLVPLYLPLPVDPMDLPKNKRSLPETGTIEFGFRVSKHGEVSDVKIVSSEPVNTFDKQFRNVMREARFRPAFENGEQVSRINQRLTHSFVYYPAVIDPSDSE